jgi:hypothetical protein
MALRAATVAEMTRRSPDERLRTAADCLRRLRTDPMQIPHERHSNWGQSRTLYLKTGLVRAMNPLAASFSPLSKPVIRVAAVTLFSY